MGAVDRIASTTNNIFNNNINSKTKIVIYLFSNLVICWEVGSRVTCQIIIEKPSSIMFPCHAVR